MICAMFTGNPIALMLMPTSLCLNIVKDILPNSKEAQDSPNNLTGAIGKAADEVSEKITGKESDIFEEIGELLETVAIDKGLLKSPKNLYEVVDKSQTVMDVITESGDVVQEVLEEGQSQDNDQNNESSETIPKERKEKIIELVQ